MKSFRATIYKLTALVLFVNCSFLHAQVTANPDSITLRRPVDTTSKPVVLTQTNAGPSAPAFKYDSTFIPKKATIRSAIIPGWGQVYNHQVWKLPFVYGAIGTTVGIFIYNVKNYKNLRRSYILLTDNDPTNDVQIPDEFKIYTASDLQRNRDIFRQNVDYSVLAFLIAWGVNVVDATVSAHLKQFDVTDDLSIKIRPTLNPQTGLGIGLVMNFK